MENYTAVEINKPEICAKTWMKLANIRLYEKATHTKKHIELFHLCKIFKPAILIYTV